MRVAVKEFDHKREMRRYWIGLAAGVSLLLSLQFNHVRLGALLDREGLKSAADMLHGLLRPNISPDFLRRVVHLSFESLFVGLLGTVLACTIGTILALVAIRVPELPDPPAKRHTYQSVLGTCVRSAARFALGFLRSIPEIVWAYGFVRLLGLGPGAAVLAIGLTVGGSIGKLFSELAEAVDPRIIGALRSAGVGRVGIMLHGILPQVRKQWVAYALFRMECNIRTGTILGVVGAGGLGSEIALSVRYFEFDKLATTLLAVLAFVIALELVSAGLRRVSVKWTLASAALGGLASFYYLDIPWVDLFTGNLAGILEPATFGFTLPYIGHVTVLMIRTVLMAWAGTILAALVAFLAAPFSTNVLVTRGYLEGSYPRRGWSRFTRQALLMAIKLALQIARAMPEITLALLFVVWVGPGAFAGILAIAVHNIGVVSRLYTDVYEEVETGPPRALEASGSSAIGVWLFSALPQVVPRLVAFTLYRFEVNLRATITVGFIGAGGAGDALNNAIALFHIGDLTILLAVMLIFVTAIDYAGDRLRRRILRGPVRRLSMQPDAAPRVAPPLHVPGAADLAAPIVFYRIGTTQLYGQARMVELSPRGMAIECEGGCPCGLVVHWLAHHLPSGKALQGMAKVVGPPPSGARENCGQILRLQFIHPKEVQIRGLHEIAATHGVRLHGWEYLPEHWPVLPAVAQHATAKAV
jgi:phosphonate transport system permease protein